MTKLNVNEMKIINGGAIDWNGSILASLIKYIKLVFEIGQALGSASRRNNTNNYCEL